MQDVFKIESPPEQKVDLVGRVDAFAFGSPSLG